MSTLTVPYFNRSGLGDRLCGMLLIVVYARMHGHNTVQVPWPNYMEPAGNPPEYRKKDILLPSVLDHLILPKGLTFVDNHETLPHLDPWWYAEVGIGMPSFHWLATIHLKEYDVEQVLHMAREVCHECSYKPHVLHASRSLGDYAAIHIRRTDKVRAKVECDTQIHVTELDDLDRRTKRAIQKAVNLGHSQFLVCSDDDSAMTSYQDFIRGLGCGVVRLPEMDKSVSTYYELAAMSGSKLIIQSQRNSAFSNYAACIRDVPLWNMYEDRPRSFR